MSKKNIICLLEMNADILDEHLFSFKKTCKNNKWDFNKADFIVDESGAYFEIDKKTKVYIFAQ